MTVVIVLTVMAVVTVNRISNYEEEEKYIYLLKYLTTIYVIYKTLYIQNTLHTIYNAYKNKPYSIQNKAKAISPKLFELNWKILL